MARAIRSSRGSGTCRTLQEGVEGLVGLLDLRRGLPGGEEVGEEGGATGGDGEGEESSASLTLLLRLRWTRQVCLATWILEREMASSAAFTRQLQRR